MIQARIVDPSTSEHDVYLELVKQGGRVFMFDHHGRKISSQLEPSSVAWKRFEKILTEHDGVEAWKKIIQAKTI